MSRLTRDGTAEPVSGDQILRRKRGQGNIHFPCSGYHDTSRIGNLTRLIHTLAKCDYHTIHSDMIAEGIIKFIVVTGTEGIYTYTLDVRASKLQQALETDLHL